MAAGDKTLGTDPLGTPFSQYYNPLTDNPEPLQGQGGGFFMAPAALDNVPGLSTYFNAALLATVQSVKAARARLYGYHIQNPGGADAWLQWFDLAAGSVVLGTTPPKLSYWVPASGALETYLLVPVAFATALSIAATTTPSGLTAPSSALVFNALFA